MEKLSDLPNIGQELATRLNKVGIKTPQQFIEMGSCKVFTLLRAVDNSACINTLYALEGAVQHIRWHKLDKATKEKLKHFFIMLQLEV